MKSDGRAPSTQLRSLDFTLQMVEATEDFEQGSITNMNLAVTRKKDWGGEPNNPHNCLILQMFTDDY